MTRAQFEERAIRQAEKRLGIPAGWWGEYSHVWGPAGEHVYYQVRNRFIWAVSVDGRLVSRHESRAYAIAKARKLAST